MIITPNNTARRPMPTVKPLRRSQPSGPSGPSYSNDSFSIITDTPDLDGMRQRVERAQGDAGWYYNRNRDAFDYWHARWPGQTIDGRKWGERDADDSSIWPWPGASDTRVRLVEMIGNEHLTVMMFALLNMKVNAEAAHPLVSLAAAQNDTKLLNYILFTHMSEEIYRELPLLVNWRNLFGSALLEVVWEQERRLYFQEINLINLQALAQYSGMSPSGAAGSQNSELGIKNDGQGMSQRLDEFISALFDPAGEETAIAIVQQASPLVTKPIARKILKDLRELRTAEIPIPEVVKSVPRWTALRPMLDVLFPPRTDDIQRAPWVSRVEYVTETELQGRVETDGYDANFVDEAIERAESGELPLFDYSSGGYFRPFNVVGPGGVSPYGNTFADDEDRLIELHHFYHRGLAHDTPAVYCTTFNINCEDPARHEPLDYQHCEYPVSAFRFEHHERPILSSSGIAEKAYTWEQEIKKQRDMRSDRTDLALKPPLFTDYDALLKMKVQFMPGTTVPVHRNGEAEWFSPPPYDPGSTQIEQTLIGTSDRFFGLFGAETDPTLKQQRTQQLADTLLLEMKPVLRQTGALIDQYLPDETAAAVLGAGVWQRPPAAQIRGRLHYTATVDMRNQDPDFLKQKLSYFVQLAGLDTMGLLDRAQLLMLGAESIDYEMAERLVKSPQPSTQQEQQDESQKDDLILASGVDQPMPMGSNFQLRLQVLDGKMQQYQQNPISARRFQQNPELIHVFQTRRQFFLRQLQQQQNAQIGRVQVGQTFNKAAAPTA